MSPNDILFGIAIFKILVFPDNICTEPCVSFILLKELHSSPKNWNTSPTESKRLFYKSVSFFSVLHIGLSLTSF